MWRERLATLRADLDPAARESDRAALDRAQRHAAELEAQLDAERDARRNAEARAEAAEGQAKATAAALVSQRSPAIQRATRRRRGPLGRLRRG
ncbi:MAG: hypothetical protein QOE65_2586 [Solirubrobacteraceae bacterium]|jgi:hypothetical protein|nr:hypothetical protein [Solirubrobacteraceae bacterium]